MMTTTTRREDPLVRTHRKLAKLLPDDTAYVYTLDPVLVEALNPGATQAAVGVLPGAPDLEDLIISRFGGGRWRVIVKRGRRVMATLRLYTVGPSILRAALGY